MVSLADDDDDGGAGDRDDEPIEVVVEIWYTGRTALDVFQSCQLTTIGAGMGGLVWIGISAQELVAALLLHRVPRSRWTEVQDDVRYMGQVVCNEHNRRAKEQREEAERKAAAQRGSSPPPRPTRRW